MLDEGLGEKKEASHVFYAAGHICSLQDSFRQNLARLDELIQLRLT